MQLYDDDASTDINVEMDFDGFDGTNYTEFTLLLEGENADANDYSRFSAYDNVNDGGIWHEYKLALTATGLDGIEVAPGVFESAGQPTGVTGSITGIFELTENQTSPANQGFYVIDLTLTMTNWAWDNRDDLMTQDELGDPIPDTFEPSVFSFLPPPGTDVVLRTPQDWCADIDNGQDVTIDIWLENAQHPVAGGQFLVGFNTDVLAYNGALGGAVPFEDVIYDLPMATGAIDPDGPVWVTTTTLWRRAASAAPVAARPGRPRPTRSWPRSSSP
jgi:hypothetical protein